eukprot:TRINITY_DN3204_c0_g1_i8.p1 TRINITY_DN3204_c0_g1~~TRINITY_DN3204_c0_g1_i8.p1  ORF type:complete len:113 (-),score=4.85 TRINITY_DN3204_c0_g1_i8:193-531(-)
MGVYKMYHCGIYYAGEESGWVRKRERERERREREREENVVSVSRPVTNSVVPPSTPFAISAQCQCRGLYHNSRDGGQKTTSFPAPKLIPPPSHDFQIRQVLSLEPVMMMDPS